ncbi:superoxide dismutase [Deinococcus sp. KSM4-11]|uniref:SMP-30/gluconolactonase/LRE family protein n=1 Tax=Deinococcus sp. KSM4-11 TaxID=2568654 RepID=UPI0010A35FC2|nr:superoxide dismutase [Deinococcus sp. KSM4-11]THF85774.1 superoxide dismutase [Deinococcus sp. KSM4-11]
MIRILTAGLLTSILAACNFGPPVATTSGYILSGSSVFPEGITHQAGSSAFYVGSTTDGTIFKGKLGTAATQVFLPAEAARPTAVGLKLDPQGRLYIAGGATGKVFVYNVATKALVQSFDTPAVSATFLNDIALTADAAYITDSQRPVLFRLARTPTGLGTLDAWLDLSGTPITYGAGFNLNGIASTPDGKYLLVVQSNTGKLYRITVADKSVTEIDLGGETLTNGDGMLLDGQTLYVVRNQNALIVPVTLSADFASGTVGSSFTDATLKYPTTIALSGSALLVVNSQFDKRGTGLTPELPFTVSTVALPR